MARKALVRWFESKLGYYTTHEGKRYRLGDGPDDFPDGPNWRHACAVHYQIISGNPPQKAAANLSTVKDSVERWMAHLQKIQSPSHRVAKDYLERVKNHKLGNTQVRNLRMADVVDWLDGQKRWGSTTQSIAYSKLRAALNWNVENGHVSVNPLKGLKRPEQCRDLPRDAAFALPDGLIEVLINTAKWGFKDYLTALWKTGARPSEIGLAEDFNYDGKLRAIVYKANTRRGYTHKTAKKTKKDRTIYLTPDVVKLVEEKIKEGGILFKSRYGKAHSRKRAGGAFDKLKKKPAVVAYMRENKIEPKNVVLYGFRHAYATKALARSVPIKLLADLMGTSVRMIEDTYGHSERETEVMRKQAEAVWA